MILDRIAVSVSAELLLKENYEQLNFDNSVKDTRTTGVEVIEVNRNCILYVFTKYTGCI